MERRVDIVNDLNVRIAILEAAHTEVMRVRAQNDNVIDGLLKRDVDLLLALNSMTGKFDRLIGQFSIGYKVLASCCGVIVIVIGAFWAWQHELDMKYMPKMDQAVRNLSENTQTLKKQNAVFSNISSNIVDQVKQQNDAVQDVAEDITAIKNKRVIKASK